MNVLSTVIFVQCGCCYNPTHSCDFILYRSLRPLYLKATISSDNTLRIYDCVEQPSLTSWQLTEELDVQTIVSGPSPSNLSRSQTLALATPTQSHATAEGASASLVAQALQQGLQQSTNTGAQRQQLGNREADGGWCLSWCKDRYWGEIIALGSGTTGIIKVRSRLATDKVSDNLYINGRSYKLMLAAQRFSSASLLRPTPQSTPLLDHHHHHRRFLQAVLLLVQATSRRMNSVQIPLSRLALRRPPSPPLHGLLLAGGHTTLLPRADGMVT